MGKFSPVKVTEYNFSSLEEMIDDILREFDDNVDNKEFGIGIALTSDETPKFITTLLSTGKFIPEWLEYDKYDYCGEYIISLNQGGEFWVSKSWCDTHEKYYPVDNELNSIVFVSQDISKEYFDIINDGVNNIVLFNVEN